MIGRLQHRVTIQRQASTQDAVGQRTQTWTAVKTVYARIQTVKSEEFYVQSGQHDRATHEVTIRYRSDVTADNRLLFGSRVFRIIGPPINIDERDNFLLMRCAEDV